MDIKGTFFDGKTARAVDVVFRAEGGRVMVAGEDNIPLVHWCNLDTCTIAPRLGNTRRVIRFSGGQRFETDDQAGMADLEAGAGVNRSFFLIHLLESHWKSVLVCFVGLLVFAVGFVRYGIPAISTHIAYRLPQGILDQASQEAEEVLTKRLLKPSTLAPERAEEIRARFRELVREITGDMESPYAFSLAFGEAKALGANAFALPSGTIVMTDQLVGMSEDIREIQGVLVHEIAHVTHRHAVRNILQSTGVFVLVSLLVGDGASVTGLAVSIPTLLLESGYSRRFETEADRRVVDYFVKKGWDIAAYENILRRLTAKERDIPGSSFISTHPGTEDRIENLRKWAARQSAP
ncbi:MAG: M48 family metallopeptidase [Desulfobacter sp.]